MQTTHAFNVSFSGTTRVSWYQKGKTNLDFTDARDSEWQWHQLGRMQVCTSLRKENDASTPPLRLFQAERPSCHPTESVKALTTYATNGSRTLCQLKVWLQCSSHGRLAEDGLVRDVTEQ